MFVRSVSFLISAFTSPKFTFLYNSNIYEAPKMTPTAVKIVKYTLTLMVDMITRNSPTNPLVPGKPTEESINTMKKKEYLGIIFVTPL